MGHDIRVVPDGETTRLACACGWSTQVGSQDVGEAAAEHRRAAGARHDHAEEDLADQIEGRRRTQM